MSHSELDHLIHMINQIADNNRAYEATEAAERVADHLKRFWARSMKVSIGDYYRAGGEQLNPIARDAIVKLGTEQTTPKPQVQSVSS